MNIVIVHYNTPELTEALVKSIRKFMGDAPKIHIFDNSEKHPFVARFDNVWVIDNTKGQIVDFDKMLDAHPDKVGTINNWGSAKHCRSIDACFDLIPDGFILIDSDMLLLRDISAYWDSDFAYVGEERVTKKWPVKIPRLWPFLCYINVPMCKEYGVRYFNSDYMWRLSSKSPNQWYDTGAWFLEDCKRKNLIGKNLSRKDYAIHFGGGSYKKSDINHHLLWLEENKSLWQ